MTDLLQPVFDAASQLPPEEQNALAARWAYELESDQQWAELFANSEYKLAVLCKEARDEHRAD